MGSQTFMTIGRGKTPRDAYQNAIDRAVENYGNDSYNGTISTTYGFSMVYGVVDSNTAWTIEKQNLAETKAYDMLNSMDKRECKAIDLGEYSNKFENTKNGTHKFLFFGWGAC